MNELVDKQIMVSPSRPFWAVVHVRLGHLKLCKRPGRTRNPQFFEAVSASVFVLCDLSVKISNDCRLSRELFQSLL